MKSPSDLHTSDERTRNLSIAVANWLCGTLEGITHDNTDLALTEALDKWLHRQKNDFRTLYIGQVTCTSCGCTWEALIASDAPDPCCPQCGARLHTASAIPSKKKNTFPENSETLETIRKGLDDVAERLSSIKRDFGTSRFPGNGNGGG